MFCEYARHSRFLEFIKANEGYRGDRLPLACFRCLSTITITITSTITNVTLNVFMKRRDATNMLWMPTNYFIIVTTVFGCRP